jgi:hypothetical protein
LPRDVCRVTERRSPLSVEGIRQDTNGPTTGRRGRHAQPSDSTVLAAAATGRDQVCVLEGPSGEGKSRLLDKCPESAEALGMSVLRAWCSELTRDYPFGISRDLFESALIPADAGDARRE